MTHGVHIDGNSYTFHQSWLNTFSMCPEQARLDMHEQLQDNPTDASAMGTAFHAGIEAILRGGELGDGIEQATIAFYEETEKDGFRWVQIKKFETAARYVSQLMDSWHRDIYPQLGEPLRLESHFDVPLEITPERTIRIAGYYDFVDHDGIWDWKSANRPYEQWEVDRYKIQPTVYTAAYAYECIAEAQRNDVDILSMSPMTFTYAVGLKGRGKDEPIQVVETTRGPEEWGWLTQQLHHIVDLIESDLEHWPLNDQGWHCSPRWCPAWESCKGKHVTINVGRV